MAFGSYTVKVRPLRIAFLVNPTDRPALQEAIEINSFLWGGLYNPIIPAYTSIPAKWEPLEFHRKNTPEEIVAGYLAGFDPDIVVPVGKCAGRKFKVGHREVVSVNKLLGDILSEGGPTYGVGLLDVLADFIDKELKYVRTEPIELIFPKFENGYSLFLSSVFGKLSKTALDLLKEHFPLYFAPQQSSCTVKNFPEIFVPNKMYPRRLGTWQLDRPLREPTIFVCNANSCLDVIDYWNLRAAGYYVIPIPIQSANEEIFIKLARDFIVENYRPYRHNPEMYHDTHVQKSRSLNEDIVKQFCDSLNVLLGKNNHSPMYLLRWWYPRIWDAWARENTEETIMFPYSHEIENPITEGQTNLELKAHNPRFDISSQYSGKPRYANEFSFRYYGCKEPMAEVFPEAIRRLSSEVSSMEYYKWRFSKNGPVFLANNSRGVIYLDLPRAESVMIEWLREQGWKAELSAPGRIAKQIITQLGGQWGVEFFAHKGVIELLREMETETGMTRQAVIGRLTQFIKAGEHFFDKLLEKSAFRLGAKVQCTVCTRHNWFELNQLDYKLHCRFCLSSFSPPINSPKDMQWTYRVHGPYAYSVAQGAYTVLLTLRFLGNLHRPGITPLFSYKATSGNKELESDLTCLYQRSIWQATHTDIIHAECKSNNYFEEKDIQRMRILGESFPGSILMFCCLKSELIEAEKLLISNFVLEERQKNLQGITYSQIVILTGNELFSRGAPECWKEINPLYQTYSHAAFNFSDLSILADATQQINLGMQSWRDWREENLKTKNENA
jgi:hypothetical protein